MNFPRIFPIVDLTSKVLISSELYQIPKECNLDDKCIAFYEKLKNQTDGYYCCPKGFSSKLFSYDCKRYSVAALVASPRFDLDKERIVSKKYPKNKISRREIDAYTHALRSIEIERDIKIIAGLDVFPQSFHELRKLNSLVLQTAEVEIGRGGNASGNLKVIKGASELIRNNFDILEALSNIEAMRALPTDNSIKLFHLAFKMKRILEGLAYKKNMRINVSGDDGVEIKGSSKSFPIVFATLIENAIKYGRENSDIEVTIINLQPGVEIHIENYSDGMIDPIRCFDKGVRFSSSEEGGGFGLYLAREIVNIHGGKISCIANRPLINMKVSF